MASRRKPRKGEGRPTAFKPEFVAQAVKLAELGATDREIAEFFDVSERTIYRWQHEHAEFCHALKVGKEAADERVVKSLYRRAVGYTFDAVKILAPKGDGAPIYAPYVEHVAPDTTACIFWLKNRRRDDWRDKVDHEMTGKDGGAIAVADATPVEIARRIAFALGQGLRAAEQETA